jgi:hypothetical protein
MDIYDVVKLLPQLQGGRNNLPAPPYLFMEGEPEPLWRLPAAAGDFELFAMPRFPDGDTDVPMEPFKPVTLCISGVSLTVLDRHRNVVAVGGEAHAMRFVGRFMPWLGRMIARVSMASH